MAARSEFPEGLLLESHKDAALREPLRSAGPPDTVVLALDQGSGWEARATVEVGSSVAVGSVVARDPQGYAATLHSPVSGRVTAVDRRETATDDGWGVCVVIENDGAARPDATLRPPCAEVLADPARLLEGLREAGMAGLGGAAFPTATKLASAHASAATRLLLNGAECEPWICCDDALLRERAGDVVRGAQLLLRAMQAESCTIAVEDDKPVAIDAMQVALAASGDARLHLEVVGAIYPRGAERQLVTAITGVEVPTRTLPAAAGVLCQNVATAAAVARWAATGEPCLRRIVTVTGSAVQRPCNVEAYIGTPLHDLIACAGGYAGVPHRLIAGGNMTGRALATDAITLTKGMNCLLAASFDDVRVRSQAREVPCIRCGDCAATCPAGLLPQQLHRAALGNDVAALQALGLVDCIECGCCDYVCPSQIPLTQRFRLAKSDMRAQEDELRRAAVARERFERHERRLRDAAAEEQRAFDLAREQARAATSTAHTGNATIASTPKHTPEDLGGTPP